MLEKEESSEDNYKFTKAKIVENVIQNIDDDVNVKKSEYWETTPRTVTQAKRLKWDQTPIGTHKILEKIERKNLWDIPPYEIEEIKIKRNNFTMYDLHKILPSKGFNIFSYNKKDFKKEITEIIFGIKNGEIIKDYKTWKSAVFEVFNDELNQNLKIEEINKILIDKITIIIVNSPLSDEEIINLLNLIKMIYDDEDTENECNCCLRERKEKVEINEFYLPDTENNRNNQKKTIKKVFYAYSKELILILSFFTKNNNENIKIMAKDILYIIFKNKCYKELLVEIKDEIGELSLKEQISTLLFNMVDYYSIEIFMPFFYSIRKSKFIHAKRILIFTIIDILKNIKTDKIFYLIDILEEFLFKDKIMLAADALSIVSKKIGVKLCIVDKLENILEIDNRAFIILDSRKRKLINLYLYLTNVDKKLNVRFYSILEKIRAEAREEKEFLFKILLRKKNLNYNLLLKIVEMDTDIILENEESFLNVVYKNTKLLEEKEISNIKSILLNYIRSKKLFYIGFKLFIDIKKYITDEEINIITIYLKKNLTNEKSIKLLHKFLKLINIEEIQQIIKETILLLENNDKKVLGLKILSKIIIYIENDDLHHFITIIYEEITASKDTMIKYYLKPLYTLFNHAFRNNTVTSSEEEIIKINRNNKNKYKRIENVNYTSYTTEKYIKNDNTKFNSIFKALPFTIEDLILSMLPLFKNNDGDAIENILEILVILLKLKINIKNREWIRLVYEAVDNLGSRKKRIRKLSTILIGRISEKVGYFNIINILLDNLRLPDRIQRINAAKAISISSKYQNIEFILPFLLVEYSVPDLNIQHGILKSLSFIVEDINLKYINYILYITVDSLKEKDVVHRKMGLEIVHNLLLRITKEYKYNDYVFKLFDLVFPNIFEESLKCIFNDCFFLFAEVLGVDYIYKYIVQGLFHPSRKVRERYRELYLILCKHSIPIVNDKIILY